MRNITSERELAEVKAQMIRTDIALIIKEMQRKAIDRMPWGGLGACHIPKETINRLATLIKGDESELFVNRSDQKDPWVYTAADLEEREDGEMVLETGCEVLSFKDWEF